MGVLFWCSLACTTLHILEERSLWRYLGDVYGVSPPKWFVWGFFVIGLAVLNGAASYAAWELEWEFGVGLLAGLRLGDAVFSHWCFWDRKNPGLVTASTLYPLEALAVLRWCEPTLTLLGGALAGVAVFGVVVPWTLQVLGQELGWDLAWTAAQDTRPHPPCCSVAGRGCLSRQGSCSGPGVPTTKVQRIHHYEEEVPTGEELPELTDEMRERMRRLGSNLVERLWEEVGEELAQEGVPSAFRPYVYGEGRDHLPMRSTATLNWSCAHCLGVNQWPQSTDDEQRLKCHHCGANHIVRRRD